MEELDNGPNSSEQLASQMAQLAKSHNEALTILVEMHTKKLEEKWKGQLAQLKKEKDELKKHSDERMAQMEEEQAKLQCQVEQLKQEKNMLQELVKEQLGKIQCLQEKGEQDAKPKKPANIWKSKREESLEIDDSQKDPEKAKCEKQLKGIRGILNKITSSTFEELANDFCAYKIHIDPKLLAPITDLIFEKAIVEPQYCPLYSDLCMKQVDVEQQLQGQGWYRKQVQQLALKEKNFRNAIIFKCQETFNESKIDYGKKMEELREKLKELDEKGRAQIEEELEMRRSKEKRRLLGIIKFIGQFYRHGLLVEEIIDYCGIDLIKRFQTTTVEFYIECAVALIKTVGKIYEQRKEQALRRRAMADEIGFFFYTRPKQEYRLDMIFSYLSQMKPNVSNRIRFAIIDLEDLHENNWIQSEISLHNI